VHTAHRALIAALALAALSLSLRADNARSADIPSGDIANGRRLYLSVGCFECHGRAGQGGRFNYPAPALAQTPLPLSAFSALVRAGPNDMPAYAPSVLAPQEVADILAFLRSLPGRRSANQIPQLNP
jgi:mono/diheme cytochrome c family protein